MFRPPTKEETSQFMSLRCWIDAFSGKLFNAIGLASTWENEVISVQPGLCSYQESLKPESEPAKPMLLVLTSIKLTQGRIPNADSRAHLARWVLLKKPVVLSTLAAYLRACQAADVRDSELPRFAKPHVLGEEPEFYRMQDDTSPARLDLDTLEHDGWVSWLTGVNLTAMLRELQDAGAGGMSLTVTPNPPPGERSYELVQQRHGEGTTLDVQIRRKKVERTIGNAPDFQIALKRQQDFHSMSLLNLVVELSQGCSLKISKDPDAVIRWANRGGIIVQPISPPKKGPGNSFKKPKDENTDEVPGYKIPIRSITVSNPHEPTIKERLLFSPHVCANKKVLGEARKQCRCFGAKTGSTSVYGVATLTGYPAWDTLAKQHSRFAGIRVRYDPLARVPELRKVPACSSQAETPVDAKEEVVVAIVSAYPPNSAEFFMPTFRTLLGRETKILQKGHHH